MLKHYYCLLSVKYINKALVSIRDFQEWKKKSYIMNTKGWDLGSIFLHKKGAWQKVWEPLAYSILSLYKFNMYCRKPAWHIIS